MSTSNVTSSDLAQVSVLLASFLDATVTQILLFDVIGITLAFFVSGYCAAKAIQYYSNLNFGASGRKEPIWIRIFIGVMLILLGIQLGTQLWEVVGMIMNFNTYYKWFRQQMRMLFVEVALIGIFMGPMTMFFIGLRTWKLYNRPRIAGIVWLLLIAGMIVAGCLSFASGFLFPLYTVYETPAQMRRQWNPSWGVEFHKRVFALMVIDIVANTSLTVANLIKFRSFLDDDVQVNGQSRHIVRKLFGMTMQSMLPACCGTIALGYFYISNKSNGTWIRMLSHIQPSLYVLACLTAVTAKAGIEKALLSNNLQLNVVSTEASEATATERPDDITRQGHLLPFDGATSKASVSSAAKMDKDFLDFLAAGPEEEEKKRTPSWGNLGISFGSSKVVLEDEEKKVGSS